MDSTAFAHYQNSLERTRMVAATQALVLERGIGPVELADVALALRMPVAAVERQFPQGKADLVLVSLTAHLTDIHEQLLAQRETCGSAVEELLAMRRLLQQHISDTASLFMQELAAGYPSLHRQLAHLRATFMLDYLQANLRRGIGEGLYRAEVDVEEQARNWLRQSDTLLQAVHTSSELAEANSEQLSRYLAELTTPAGRYVARRLQEAPPYY